MADYTYPVRAAITWQILNEILRRHGTACQLRVLETHPCSGMYDCLSLYSGPSGRSGRHLCDFHVLSQHVHIFEHYGEPRARLEDLGWTDGNDYVEAFLRGGSRTSVSIEDVLGLPEFKAAHRPPTTPQVLTVRIIAALWERFALQDISFDVRSGYRDGYFPGLSEFLFLFPDVVAQLPKDREPWETQVTSVADRFWLAFRRIPHSDAMTGVLLDDLGMAYWTGQPEKPWSFWDQYRSNGRKLRPIVNQMEDMILS